MSWIKKNAIILAVLQVACAKGWIFMDLDKGFRIMNGECSSFE